MASIRERAKADGTVFWSVLYRLDGKQTSTSFGEFVEASRFRDMANKFGVKNAVAAVQAQAKVHGGNGFTVSGWLSRPADPHGARCDVGR
jgi:hypothetical protein